MIENGHTHNAIFLKYAWPFLCFYNFLCLEVLTIHKSFEKLHLPNRPYHKNSIANILTWLLE